MTLGAITATNNLLPTRSVPPPATTQATTATPSTPVTPLPQAPTPDPGTATSVDGVFDLQVRIRITEVSSSDEPQHAHGRHHFQGVKQRALAHLENAARGLNLSTDQQQAFDKLAGDFGTALQDAWNAFREAKDKGSDAYKTLADSLKKALDTFFDGFSSVLSGAPATTTTTDGTTLPATTTEGTTTTGTATTDAGATTGGAVIAADPGLSLTLPTPDVTNATQGNAATTTSGTTATDTTTTAKPATIPEGTLSALRAEVDRIFEAFSQWLDKREAQSTKHAHGHHRHHDVDGTEQDDTTPTETAPPATDAAPASSPTADTAVRETTIALSFRASFYMSYGANA